MTTYREEIYGLRAKLVTALEAHEAACPEGRKCRERYNLIAWLAHSLGVHTDNLAVLREAIGLYEANCPDCAHRRN